MNFKKMRLSRVLVRLGSFFLFLGVLLILEKYIGEFLTNAIGVAGGILHISDFSREMITKE